MRRRVLHLHVAGAARELAYVCASLEVVAKRPRDVDALATPRLRGSPPIH